RLSVLSRVFLMLEPADDPDLWAQWGRWRRTAAAGGEAEEKTTCDDAGTEAPCHAGEALAVPSPDTRARLRPPQQQLSALRISISLVKGALCAATRSSMRSRLPRRCRIDPAAHWQRRTGRPGSWQGPSAA
ncbi:MAG: hypothetical protein AB7X49_17510, partial [Geminicoccaceae bacterium]